MKFKLPLSLKKTEFAVFGAGSAAKELDKFLDNTPEIKTNLKYYVDDRAGEILGDGFSKEIITLGQLRGRLDEVECIAVCTRFDIDRDKIINRLEELFAEEMDIVSILPVYPDASIITEIAFDRLEDAPLVIVDCGAIGGDVKTDRILSKVSSDQVRVFGFDPNEEACEKQTKDNVVCSPYIVSDVTGQVDFHPSGEDCGTVYPIDDEFAESLRLLSSFKSRDSIKLNAITLDDFFSAQGVSPDILKINVDGAELDILKGGAKALADIVFCVVEVNLSEYFKGAGRFYDVAKLMDESGFMLYQIKDVVRDYRVNSLHHFADSQPIQQDYYYFRKEFSDIWKLLKAASVAEIFDYHNLACWMLEYGIRNFSDADKALAEGIYEEVKSEYKTKYF